MDWSMLYAAGNPPTWDMIHEYIDNPLWQDLNLFLQNRYEIQPRLSYSQCSMQPGWNVKYQKGGKSLCTLYPGKGSFIALVVIGNKELDEAELLISQCSKHVQELYQNTSSFTGGRWLMIHVTDQAVLRDVKSLIQIRKSPRHEHIYRCK